MVHQIYERGTIRLAETDSYRLLYRNLFIDIDCLLGFQERPLPILPAPDLWEPAFPEYGGRRALIRRSIEQILCSIFGTR